MRIASAVASSRLLLPLAAYAALASLAHYEVRPAAAAETSYLAFLAAGVLLSIGALALRPELEAGLASLLAVATVWLLPAGPGRGATLTVLLAAALAAVALRRLAHDRWSFSPANIVPLAVALQLLWRADALLAPLQRVTGLGAVGPLAATVFDLLILPCLGAAVILLLASLRWRPEAILTTVALVLLLLPALSTPAARDLRGVLRLLAWLPILAPAVVLAALHRPQRFRSRWRAVAPHIWSAQAMWSGCLLFGATVLAGYPWLRVAPAENVLGLIGLHPGWGAALAVLVATAVIGNRRWPYPARTTGLALCLAVFLALPTAGPAVLDHTTLTAASPTAAVALDPKSPSDAPVPVTAVVVDSYLSYGTMVPAGAAVARLRLHGIGGESEEWTLRNGRETGEWAARRPEIAVSPTLETPPPWLSWVTTDRLFFGQRYRAVHRLSTRLTVDRVQLTLEPGIAPEVALTVTGVELRR